MGKTRTAASLTEVFSRANRVTNVLFLTDRTAQVIQAGNDFKKGAVLAKQKELG